MKRDEALELIAVTKDDGISVTTMRSVGKWLELGQSNERHIDCIGCMGGAASLGLGLALAQPSRKVYVVDGDGSLLMQLGGLASVAGQSPENYYHFLLVNRVYETSGQQRIPAAEKVDFATLARGAGYRVAESFDDIAVLRERLPAILDAQGPVFVALEVDPEDYGDSTNPTRDPDPAGLLRSQLVQRA